MKINYGQFENRVLNYLLINYGKNLDEAEEYEKYTAVSKSVMEIIAPLWKRTREETKNKKQVHYLSLEFLMGRFLGNSLLNLRIYHKIREKLNTIGIELNIIEEIEEDAGLGNGGLGRLAACFLDSCATMSLPVTGYGIRYKYGLFRQKIINSEQREYPDNWQKYGDPWSVRREDLSVLVNFADSKIKAVPYDMPVIGYSSDKINTLRLWQAEPVSCFEFRHFNEQNYMEAFREKNLTEYITYVLYPNDTKESGKILRIKQQYFFVSATLQDTVKSFVNQFGTDFNLFPLFNCFQLNDTHPAVAIPELIRILCSNYHMDFESAWQITVKSFAYTNHTVLQEAFEKWPARLYKDILPEVFKIIKKIDRLLKNELINLNIKNTVIKRMKIISDNTVMMARLSVYGSHTVNGVAELHSELLKNEVLSDWHSVYPHKFKNITNGITQRRWLMLANPELSELITELIGNEHWLLDLDRLKDLEKFKNDKSVLQRFLEIKKTKKKQLSEYILQKEEIKINPESIYDIQIKRLHEYKRQLLNAFHILHLYFRLKENPDIDIIPRTFIFGAKAAPGYKTAKTIIKYINNIKELVNSDKSIFKKIRIVFVSNYNVSFGEKLFPAADISEQISTAGKEASGTGNMKFMMNGTPTIGTYDGSNIEIIKAAGRENNYIFGTRVNEINKLRSTYNPEYYYNNIRGLKKVVNTLIDNTFISKNNADFLKLYRSLLTVNNPDSYFIFKDFESYSEAHCKIDKDFRDRPEWAKKCWINLCNSGYFSSDRSVKEYAENIWKVCQN
jgi:glycogen phosphorylase